MWQICDLIDDLYQSRKLDPTPTVDWPDWVWDKVWDIADRLYFPHYTSSHSHS